MEEKSLRIINGNKTFISKITNTLTKMLVPTRIGMNTIMITIKRNSLLKVYNAYEAVNGLEDADKKEALYKKYEDAYTLYLEAIDKYIIDSVYKRVKNDTATSFERDALVKYYTVVALKDKQYVEYKHKKQEYLIKVDFEAISENKKSLAVEKYNKFYVSKMDSLYKGMLRNYSIQLSDKQTVKLEGMDNIYDKIYDCLEAYVIDVLPVKMKVDKGLGQDVIVEYDRYESVIIGKLDQKDAIRKRIALLGISRLLFTHSLPLVAAGECYDHLIHECRKFLLTDSNELKIERTFELLVELIEEYHIKLLSTKVYWDKSEEKERYKVLWDNFKEIEKDKKDRAEYIKKKQALFLKHDLREVNKLSKKYGKIVNIYKTKLVELKAMRKLPKWCGTTHGKYKKVVLCKK